MRDADGSAAVTMPAHDPEALLLGPTRLLPRCLHCRQPYQLSTDDDGESPTRFRARCEPCGREIELGLTVVVVREGSPGR